MKKLKHILVFLSVTATVVYGPGSAHLNSKSRPNEQKERHTSHTINPAKAKILPGKISDICRANQVDLSPNKLYAIFSLSHLMRTSLVSDSDQITVASIPCITKFNFNEKCLLKVENYNGLRFVAGDLKKSLLYSIDSKENLISINLKNTSNFSGSIVDKKFVGRDIGETADAEGPLRTGKGSEIAPYFINRYKNITKNVPATSIVIRSQIGTSAPEGVISYDKSTLSSSWISSGQQIELPLLRPFLDFTTANLNEKNRLTISGYGWKIIDGRDSTSQQRVPPYSREIISPETGRIIGQFSPRRIWLDQNHGLRRARATLLSNRDLLLKSFSADENGNYVGILRGLFQKSLIFGSIDGKSFRSFCPATKTLAVSGLRILNIGSTDWPLPITAVEVLKPKGIVVYFRGGPATDASDLEHLSALAPFVQRGWAAISVGYSGSKGAGKLVATRLHDDGALAFRRDARYLKTYLEKRYPNIPIAIYAESFGAVAGSALESKLSNRAGLFVGIVPFFRSHPPSQWVDESSVFGGDVDYQERWESAVLGIKDEHERNLFNNEIGKLSRDRSPMRPAILIFGAYDERVHADDVPPIFRENYTLYTSPQNHDFIYADKAVADLVNSAIDKLELDRSRPHTP